MERARSAGAGAALCAWLAVGCQAPAEPSPPRTAPRPAATVAPVEVRDAVGVLVADQVADVAPTFAGILLRVLVRAGDSVTSGQVVAELDPRPLQEEVRGAEAARGAAEASRRQAMVDIEDAQRRLAVETAAAGAGVSPTTNVDEAKLAVKRAEAAAQRALASVAAETSRLTTARSHLTESKLVAPFAGQVAIRYFDAGATLSAGRAVVRLVGGAAVRLRFAVEPTHAARLAPGVVVTATIETLAAPVAAVIRQVSPALDPASGMLFVEAELQVAPELRAGLRPGLAAMVRAPH